LQQQEGEGNKIIGAIRYQQQQDISGNKKVRGNKISTRRRGATRYQQQQEGEGQQDISSNKKVRGNKISATTRR